MNNRDEGLNGERGGGIGVKTKGGRGELREW